MAQKPVRDRSPRNDHGNLSQNLGTGNPIFPGQTCPGQVTGTCPDTLNPHLSPGLPPYREDRVRTGPSGDHSSQSETEPHMTPTPSERGRANRRKGHDAERAVATYLRTAGWPHAERAIRTAYTGTGRAIPDPGDITGTPALVWQVKDHQREHITDWLTETQQQRRDADADFGILIQRRQGKADPGRWWAWFTVIDLVRLYEVSGASHYPAGQAPVRLELQHAVAILRMAGYGEPEADQYDDEDTDIEAAWARDEAAS